MKLTLVAAFFLCVLSAALAHGAPDQSLDDYLARYDPGFRSAAQQLPEVFRAQLLRSLRGMDAQIGPAAWAALNRITVLTTLGFAVTAVSITATTGALLLSTAVFAGTVYGVLSLLEWSTARFVHADYLARRQQIERMAAPPPVSLLGVGAARGAP